MIRAADKYRVYTMAINGQWKWRFPQFLGSNFCRILHGLVRVNCPRPIEIYSSYDFQVFTEK